MCPATCWDLVVYLSSYLWHSSFQNNHLLTDTISRPDTLSPTLTANPEETLKRGTQGIVHPRNKCFSWETGTTTAVLWWSACSSTISSLCTDPSLHTGLSKGRRYWSSPCLINSISSCWRVPSRRQNESIGTAQSELINDCLESKQWGPSKLRGTCYESDLEFRPLLFILLFCRRLNFGYANWP